MEQKDSYPAVHQQYPPQAGPMAPPANYTPATVYPGTYTSPNYAAPQIVISTQPPIQPTSDQQYNPRYPPQYAEQPSGWFSVNQKNKPQSNSVGAVALIFISGGMNIAWSCLYTSTISFNITTHMKICWFIGAIIGAICSSVLTNFIPKKPIYMFASVLVTIGGVIFLATPHDGGAITAALYMDGIANGLAIVPMLLLAGEEVIPTMRGKIVSIIEVMSYTCGIFLQIVIAATYGNNYYITFGATELHGILSIIYGGVSLLIAAFLVIESPVFYLQRNNEDQAIESLRRLQRPFSVTYETYRLLSDAKNYVDANRADPYIGLPALLKLCIYRGLSGLCFSKYTTYALLIAATYATGPYATWPYIISGCLLWLGAFIAAFMLDSAGRKWPVLSGALVCGGMALGIGIIFDDISGLNTALYLFFILQFGASFFMSAMPVYSAEAFPLRLKSYYVAIAFIVQMLVLIIVGASEPKLNDLSGYFITMGVLYLLFFLLGLAGLPETKNDTLREAQDKFKDIWYLRLRNVQ